MRIIGGEFRSRRLKTLQGLALRPTPDRLRETLFDILSARIEGAVFLDAYAGSGAVGIEALSRGAARAILIEKHPAAVAIIQENLASLGIGVRAEVVRASAIRVLERYHPDVAFLDPPYDHEKEYAAALRILGAQPPELVIAQHSIRVALNDEYGRLRRVRTVKQGDNVLSFYEKLHPVAAGRSASSATGFRQTGEKGAPRRARPEGFTAGDRVMEKNTHQYRILFVDDDPLMLHVGRYMLKSAGYQVRTAAGPAEALALFDPADIDLLVTDIVMPEMSGVELASRLAILKPALNVLFISGYEMSSRPSGLRYLFLPKPFETEQLIEAVAALLDGSPSNHPAPSASVAAQ